MSHKYPQSKKIIELFEINYNKTLYKYEADNFTQYDDTPLFNNEHTFVAHTFLANSAQEQIVKN